MDLQRIRIVVLAALIACGGVQTSIDEGNAALAAGDPVTAEAAFSDALKAGPDRADAWLGRGKANLGIGHAETALSDLRKAAALDGTLVEAWRLLSVHETEPSARLAAAEQVVALAPDDVEARKVRGGARLAAGDGPGAAEDFEMWLVAHGDDKDGWGLYGDALLEADRPYEAWEAFQNGSNKATREPRALTVIKKRARTGDMEAITFLRRVNEPLEAYLDQAEAMYKAGRMQAALEAGRKAVAVNHEPNSDRARSLAITAAAHVGLLVDPTFVATRGATTPLERERAFKEIVKDCEESIAIEPSTLAWRTKGFAHLQLHQGARAIEAFSGALAFDPEDLATRRMRAEAAESEARYDVVIVDVDFIEKAGKLTVEDLLRRARAKAMMPEAGDARADFDRAVTSAESAQKASGDLYTALKARGLFRSSQGDTEGARADLSRARKLRPVRDEELEAVLGALGGPLP